MPVRRAGALAVYAVALGVSTARDGLPIARGRTIIWVVLALVALCADRPRRLVRGLLVDWLPFFVALVFYDVMRGTADDLTARAHLDPHRWFDDAVFGTVPTLALQDALWSGEPRVHDYIAWVVYLTHFVVPLGVAVVLWERSERAFRRYVAALLGLTFAAFATYVAYPAIPPWLASKDGDLAPTTRIVGEVFSTTGVRRASELVDTGTALSNPVAALPSLHAAVPLLLVLLYWSAARHRWQRVVLASYPPVMAVVLVYGAEHYVFDILLGWAYAAAVVLTLRTLSARRGNVGEP
ncbi:MAG TPA: phosphatase PAP2 family protein [Mycobacteriales bacterium]|nr:phosphatase PAP2 family protein [Mycobacteriales bacterium]